MSDSNKEFHSAKEKFIDFLKKQGKASATILAYGNDIKQFVDFLTEKKGVTKITSVFPEHIEDFKKYLTEKKYVAKSISRKLNSIKTFFRFLLSQGLIKKDPASIVSHPHYEPASPRILSKIEYRALRDCARDDPRLAAIVEVLLQTGMRVGELARLALDDINDKEIQIAPYESNPGRTVSLNSAAKKALQRWLDFRPKTTSKNVFITKNGKPLPVRNIRTLFNRLFKKAGIENATINSLRHTFIAHQLMAGAPIELVQKTVGHKRLSTTEKYLELIKNQPPAVTKLEEL